jgi:hypothetical protein
MDKYEILGSFLVIFIIIVCLYIYFDNYGAFDLKCIISTVDGKKYCVRERKNIQKASDLLAKTCEKMQYLVDNIGTRYPNRENVKRLVDNFNPTTIKETLPTSEYTAYSENKGEKIAFCLSKKKGDVNKLIDSNTLTFVAIHELSHVMSSTIGHNDEFWNNFKFLLEHAVELKIYEPTDYKKEPEDYCGMTITDNPYYDL